MRLKIVFFACILLVGACSSGGVQDDAGRQVTDVYSLFAKGDLRLRCELSCAFAGGVHIEEWDAYYKNKIWKDLALSVAQVNFKSGLAYFYLGQAAEGSGLYKAADIYYGLSNATSFKCAEGQCNGIVLPMQAIDALGRIAPKIFPTATTIAPASVPSPTTLPITVPTVPVSTLTVVPAVNEVVEIKPSAIALPSSVEKTIEPISVADWKEIIGNKNNSEDSIFLDEKIASLIEEEVYLVNHNRDKDAAEFGLKIIPIILRRIEIKKDASETLHEGLSVQRKFMSQQGVKDSVIDEAIRNFNVAFPYAPPKLLVVRQPSSTEVGLIKAALKRGLKDPGSAIFGEMKMVGNDYACVKLNAKNSYGGYTGATPWLALKKDGKWIGGLNIGMSMGVCIEFAQNYKD